MFRSISDSVLGFLESVLTFLHDIVEPVFGVHSWGWAIILLTLVVRILLLPLAIKQTRSMRAMQAIQPKIKEIQKKYKADRELMKKDPEKYKAKRQKMNEEMMALYQEEGVNPAASCLPLLAQAPVFIALFWTIRGMDELQNAPFYFFTSFIEIGEDGLSGLGALVSSAGWPGWLLIVVMSGTMFITQKQMMARTAATGGDNPMAQQQKILLYVMPLFLAVISFQFMLGLLLYWVTTNVWQVAQQWIILREVKAEAASGELRDKPGGDPAGKGGATSGGEGTSGSAGKGGATSGKGGATSGKGGATSGKQKDHGGSGTPTDGSTASPGADRDDGSEGGGSPNDDSQDAGTQPSPPGRRSNGDRPGKKPPTGPKKGGERPPKTGNRSSTDHLPRRGGRD
ncbi:MAG: membrane protein insertase YidC [Nitriliruptoraceae bacterium]